MSSPPRCLGCDYPLAGLDDDGICPECGRSYNFRYPSTYTTRPPYNPAVLWLPGLLQALTIGLILALAFVGRYGHWDIAVLIAIPFSAGSLLGYRFRCKWLIGPVLLIAFAVTLIVGLATLARTGIFRGLALVALFIGPVVTGMVMGWLLRAALKQTRFPQRGYLPAIALTLALPAFTLSMENAGV